MKTAQRVSAKRRPSRAEVVAQDRERSPDWSDEDDAQEEQGAHGQEHPSQIVVEMSESFSPHKFLASAVPTAHRV